MFKPTHPAKALFNTRIMATLLVSAVCSIGVAQAAKDAADSKVEFQNNLPITQEEIAAVNVLSEICPKILGKNPNFDAGYRRLLTDLLPDLQDPVTAIRALQDDQEYQQKMAQAREDAKKASVEDNREICLDVVQYQSANAAATPDKK